MMLKVFQEYLNNEFRLLPVRVVNVLALSMLILIAGVYIMLNNMVVGKWAIGIGKRVQERIILKVHRKREKLYQP